MKQISFNLDKNENGIKSQFNTPLQQYNRRLIYLYSISPYKLQNGNFETIINHLQTRANKGRILPKPERVLTIIKRLSSKGG